MELCYVLDDNAYILSDPEAEHAGRFFGSVERKIMHILIEDKVYESIKVYDYQAVCYEDRDIVYKKLMKMKNAALSVVLWNPLKSILAVLTTLLTTAQAFSSFMSNSKFQRTFNYSENLVTSLKSQFFCKTFQQ
jgi:Neuronal voltage-dependent calcium channel alpha 2acd